MNFYNDSRFKKIFIAACSGLLLSCAAAVTKKPAGESFSADVLTIDPASISSVTSVPKFNYGPKTFSRLTDVNSLSGFGLTLLQGGDLSILDQSGTIITNSIFQGGRKATLEYRLQNGIVQAKTSKSLAMLSAMYQFDSLVNSMESLMGVSANTFFQKSGSFSVLWQPAILIDDEGEKIRTYESSNAAYLAGAKQFALFKTAESESIPLSFNPQIIAHEFGHAIFEYSFFNNQFSTCTVGEVGTEKLFKGRLETEYIIRGLNEGFADFVSFVWTGTGNVLESSLGELNIVPQRNFPAVNFSYDALSVNANTCSGQFYCVGTLWARVLLDFFQARNLDATKSDQRHAFLREIVAALRTAGDKLRANNGAALPEPDADVIRCKPRSKLVGILDDEILGVFFKAFVESISANQRKTLCEKIALRFGNSGFATRFRGGCS